jgi:hypothetical protein
LLTDCEVAPDSALGVTETVAVSELRLELVLYTKTTDDVVAPLGLIDAFRVAVVPLTVADSVVTNGAADGVKLNIWPEFEPLTLAMFNLK